MATGLSGLVAGFIGFASGRTPTGGEIVPSKAGKSYEIGAGDSLTVVTWNIHYGGGPTLARGRGQTQSEVFGYLETIAKTIKGYGTGAGQGQNTAHNTKKVDIDSLKKFRDRFDIPLSDEQLKDLAQRRDESIDTSKRWLSPLLLS